MNKHLKDAEGASLLISSELPSFDLSSLAKAMSNHLSESQTSIVSVYRDTIRMDVNSFVISLLNVIKVSDTFKKASFFPLMNEFSPKKNEEAVLGGKIVRSSEKEASKSIQNLHALISVQLDQALDGRDITSFVFDDFFSQISSINASKEVMDTIKALRNGANLQNGQASMQITTAHSKYAKDDIARFFIGREIVYGDWLNEFIEGVKAILRKKGKDDEDTESIARGIFNEAKLEGTQLNRLVHFLEDDALSRARLVNSMRIMQKIALNASFDFKNYVNAISACFDIFVENPTDDENLEIASLKIDVGSVLGDRNNTHLANEFRNVGSYYCLPVWSEISGVMNEDSDFKKLQFESSGNQFKTQERQIIYRFRINGIVPIGEDFSESYNEDKDREPYDDTHSDDYINDVKGKKTRSFDLRVGRNKGIINKEFSNHDHSKGAARRAIFQTIFLTIVSKFIGRDSEIHYNEIKKQIRILIGTIAHQIQTLQSHQLKDYMSRMFVFLEDKSKNFESLGAEMERVIKVSNPQDLFSPSSGSLNQDVIVSISKGILNMANLLGADEDSTNSLLSNPHEEEKIHWFACLSAKSSHALGSLASVRIKTEANEVSLVLDSQGIQSKLQRDVSVTSIPFLMASSYQKNKTGGQTKSKMLRDIFSSERGIEAVLLEKLINKDPDNKKNTQESQELRALSVISISILMYIVLWEIIRRVKALHPHVFLSALRIQEGEESKSMYAISHAINMVISRELNSKMQGIIAHDKNLIYRKRNSVISMLGGLPLFVPSEGDLNRVALISYIVRPSSKVPKSGDQSTYLFIAKSYVLEKQSDGRSMLKVHRVITKNIENIDDIKHPQTILDEIRLMYDEGFRDIIVLSYFYGNRKIGRTKERHSPQSEFKFLSSMNALFSDACIYPMRCDVIPLVRIRKPKINGFEILNMSSQRILGEDSPRRSLIPVYGFATFNTVGGETGKPQSGVNTFFFDSDASINEDARARILGSSNNKGIQRSLLSILKHIHYFESEKQIERVDSFYKPVLYPFDWVNPRQRAEVGEFVAFERTRRDKGDVFVSIPAILTHVSEFLHKMEQTSGHEMSESNES